MKGRILESGEDYLETILILQNRNGEVRSVDIATEMDFSKPSVSVAMKNLREQECITVDKNGYITLTDKGRGIAEKVYERHILFTNWLTSMGVPEEIGRMPYRALPQRRELRGDKAPRQGGVIP